MDASLLRSIKSLIAATATLVAAYAIAAAPPLALQGIDAARLQTEVATSSGHVPLQAAPAESTAPTMSAGTARDADARVLAMAERPETPASDRSSVAVEVSTRLNTGGDAQGVKTTSIVLALLGIVATIVSRRFIES